MKKSDYKFLVIFSAKFLLSICYTIVELPANFFTNVVINPILATYTS
jgi:hypothetical protein